jgi:hypothetical protein
VLHPSWLWAQHLLSWASSNTLLAMETCLWSRRPHHPLHCQRTPLVKCTNIAGPSAFCDGICITTAFIFASEMSLSRSLRSCRWGCRSSEFSVQFHGGGCQIGPNSRLSTPRLLSSRMCRPCLARPVKKWKDGIASCWHHPPESKWVWIANADWFCAPLQVQGCLPFTSLRSCTSPSSSGFW